MILITGATGAVGRPLITALLASLLRDKALSREGYVKSLEAFSFQINDWIELTGGMTAADFNLATRLIAEWEQDWSELAETEPARIPGPEPERSLERRSLLGRHHSRLSVLHRPHLWCTPSRGQQRRSPGGHSEKPTGSSEPVG